MIRISVTWFSNVLGKQTTTQVLLPEQGTSPFPALYLLHGMSDDSTIWSRRTRIESYAGKWPMMIVMPDGYLSFYTNAAAGPRYAAHFGEELPAFIERTFPARAERSARGIGGLSMGGYGAFRVGLEYADRFGAINGHSSAFGCCDVKQRVYDQARFRGKDTAAYRNVIRQCFGANSRGTQHDLRRLATTARAARRLPALLLDCGRQDYLLEDNRWFSAELNRLKIPHLYREFEGTHDWDYWDTHVQEALQFHAKHFGLTPLA